MRRLTKFYKSLKTIDVPAHPWVKSAEHAPPITSDELCPDEDYEAQDQLLHPQHHLEEHIPQLDGHDDAVKERTLQHERFSEFKKCVMGSGRCSTHHTKLIRSQKSKKMSVIGKDWTVSWTYRDVTCLKCPAVSNPAHQARAVKLPGQAVTSQPDVRGPTNKKTRISMRRELDQSASSTSDDVIED